VGIAAGGGNKLAANERGFEYLVFGIWYLVLGFLENQTAFTDAMRFGQIQVLDKRVPSTKYQVPNTEYQLPFHP
jgi:hypothetical protein